MTCIWVAKECTSSTQTIIILIYKYIRQNGIELINNILVQWILCHIYTNIFIKSNGKICHWLGSLWKINCDGICNLWLRGAIIPFLERYSVILNSSQEELEPRLWEKKVQSTEINSKTIFRGEHWIYEIISMNHIYDKNIYSSYDYHIHTHTKKKSILVHSKIKGQHIWNIFA